MEAQVKAFDYSAPEELQCGDSRFFSDHTYYAKDIGTWIHWGCKHKHDHLGNRLMAVTWQASYIVGHLPGALELLELNQRNQEHAIDHSRGSR